LGLLAATAALALYWPGLQTSLIYDTLLHIRIASGLDFLSVWLPAEEFGFYRPLTFLPLIAIRALCGYYPAVLLNALNIGQHALNAGLVVALSWRLWRDGLQALASGLLLALYPFASQAVAVYGHATHPTAAGIILLALHAFLNARRTGRWIWWVTCALLFVFGLLSHEAVVLLGPLAALVQWNAAATPDRSTARQPGDLQSRRADHPWRQALPWALLTVSGFVYVLLYQTFPLTRAPESAGDAGWWLRALYLMQGAAHPLAWLGRRLPGVSSEAAVTGGVVAMVALTVWAGRRRSLQRPLLLGWGWWGAASLLVALPLSTDYLLHGPRLLYLGGVGVCLLWPLLLHPLRRVAAGLPWMLILGFVLLTGGVFVHRQLGLYGELTEPVKRMQHVMAGQPDDEGVLLVNLPAWLSPTQNTYPVGSEHVAMLGYHLFVEELVAHNLRGDRPTLAIQLPEVLTDPGFPLQVIGETDLSRPISAAWAAAGSQVLVVTYSSDAVTTRHAGALSRTGEETALQAQLGPWQLISTLATACGEAVELETSWRWDTGSSPAPTFSLSVQILSEDGRLVGQADGPPLGLRANLVDLEPGWQAQDRRQVPLLAGELPSHLYLGAYDFASGNRLPGYGPDGTPLADAVLVVPIHTDSAHCTAGQVTGNRMQ
jgi:hypothetical protein